MQHGIITAWVKGKVKENGGDAKFIGVEHKPYHNSYKPAEGSFAGKTRFKVA